MTTSRAARAFPRLGLALVVVALFVVYRQGLLGVGPSAGDPDRRPDAPQGAPCEPRTAGTIPPEDAPLDLPGQELWRGTYDLAVDGAPAGTEEFRITHRGTMLFADVRRRPHGEPPVKLVLELTEAFDFRRARFTRYTDPAQSAQYRREGAMIRATTATAEGPRAQELRLPRGGVVLPPCITALQLLVSTHELSIGEQRRADLAIFGDPGWSLTASEGTLSRLDDRDEPGSSGPVQVYTLTREVGGVPETTTIHRKAGGHLLRAVIRGSRGTTTATLRTALD